MPDTKTAKQGTAVPAMLRALPGPKGDLWATVAAVADAVGKRYSTVTENLRTMALNGQVESRKLGRNTVWRKLVAAPKLRRDDVPVPRAATVTAGADVKTASKTAPRKAPKGQDAQARSADLATASGFTHGTRVWFTHADIGLTEQPGATRFVNETAGVGDEGRFVAALPTVDDHGFPWALVVVQRGGRELYAPVPQGWITTTRPATTTADDGDVVWMAICRRGLEFHDLENLAGQTLCTRSTASATSWFGTREAAVSAGGKPCPRCAAVATAESPVEASEPAAVPKPPPAANTPAGGDAGAVMAFLEAQRPVSAQPAPTETKTRTGMDTLPASARKQYARWQRGELQTAILDHMRGLPEGEEKTPYAVAVALNSGPGATAYALDRLRIKGTVTQTSIKPQRYAAV